MNRLKKPIDERKCGVKDNRECCGTCRWSITMPMDEHYCDNEDSEGYGRGKIEK
ncbi:MAG: hypothetical protein LUD12_13265 [Lachnospiraceae bacterium]|nr:hypothetical protein [Lachnospiraceae bacterium]